MKNQTVGPHTAQIHEAGFGELRMGKPEDIDTLTLAAMGTSSHFCRVDDWRSEEGRERMAYIKCVVNTHGEMLMLLDACLGALADTKHPALFLGEPLAEVVHRVIEKAGRSL